MAIIGPTTLISVDGDEFAPGTIHVADGSWRGTVTGQRMPGQPAAPDQVGLSEEGLRALPL